MGLLDQFRAYVEANTPRNTRPRVSPATVLNEGLLNPNEYNAPAANRFKDSAFGLLGVVPGVGDAASAAESADLFNRGENFAGSVAALGALPLIPSFAGMVKGGGKVADALPGLLDAGGDSAKIGKMEDFESAYKNAIKQDQHAVYGLRVIPKGHNVKHGDMLENSRIWDENGNMTDEMLPGVSTIEIDKDGVQKALEHLKKAGYYGDQVVLVKGDSAGFGQDAYERLIKDAEVVHALPYDFKSRSVGRQ